MKRRLGSAYDELRNKQIQEIWDDEYVNPINKRAFGLEKQQYIKIYPDANTQFIKPELPPQLAFNFDIACDKFTGQLIHFISLIEQATFQGREINSLKWSDLFDAYNTFYQNIQHYLKLEKYRSENIARSIDKVASVFIKFYRAFINYTFRYKAGSGRLQEVSQIIIEKVQDIAQTLNVLQQQFQIFGNRVQPTNTGNINDDEDDDEDDDDDDDDGFSDNYDSDEATVNTGLPSYYTGTVSDTSYHTPSTGSSGQFSQQKITPLSSKSLRLGKTQLSFINPPLAYTEGSDEDDDDDDDTNQLNYQLASVRQPKGRTKQKIVPTKTPKTGGLRRTSIDSLNLADFYNGPSTDFQGSNPSALDEEGGTGARAHLLNYLQEEQEEQKAEDQLQELANNTEISERDFHILGQYISDKTPTTPQQEKKLRTPRNTPAAIKPNHLKYIGEARTVESATRELNNLGLSIEQIGQILSEKDEKTSTLQALTNAILKIKRQELLEGYYNPELNPLIEQPTIIKEQEPLRIDDLQHVAEVVKSSEQPNESVNLPLDFQGFIANEIPQEQLNTLQAFSARHNLQANDLLNLWRNNQWQELEDYVVSNNNSKSDVTHAIHELYQIDPSDEKLQSFQDFQERNKAIHSSQKRGRKKSTDEEHEEERQPKVLDIKETPSRGRGRPPGSTKKATPKEESEEIKAHITPATATRGRGRPPGSKNKAKERQSEASGAIQSYNSNLPIDSEHNKQLISYAVQGLLGGPDKEARFNTFKNNYIKEYGKHEWQHYMQMVLMHDPSLIDRMNKDDLPATTKQKSKLTKVKAIPQAPTMITRSQAQKSDTNSISTASSKIPKRTYTKKKS